MPGTSKKISELDSASSLGNNDLLEVAVVNALSETGYSSKKTTIEDIADKVVDINPQAQADWTEADNTDPSYIQNKPTLATVATSGSYNDLQDQPTIPAAQVNSDWNSVSGVSEILNKPTLGTAASKNTGVANGVAELDANGLVPTSQLPAYVDDVLEYASQSAFPATGETGKIYVALDTNLTYRWGGSAYVEISPSLALGETSSTAYAGNKGKANADAIAALQTTVSGLATVATTGDYDDLIDKPTIPTVNNATVTFTQGGTTKGSITLNQAADATIALDAGGGGGASSLNDLSDVTITSPTAGQVLYFDGDEWVNHEGGGSGGGSIQIDTLYSGTAVLGDVVPLSSAYTNYDMLMFRCYNTNMGGYFGSSWNVGSISINDSMLVGYATAGQDRRLIGTITSTTTFSIGASENGTQLKEIVGYKFGGGGGGHTILDDEGTSLTQRTELQFKGAYSIDNNTDQVTEVNVVREMTKAEFDLLTDDEKVGIINVIDTTSSGDNEFQPVIYSEDEREIGVWTDGKPLYQKTLVVNPFAIAPSGTLAHNISNVDIVVDYDIFITREGSVSLKFAWATTNNSSTTVSVDDTNIVFSGTDNWPTNTYTKLYATIRYTKTTDTAGSGTWTPQGVPTVKYSTTEHIVGTWIDGSTLYEKTVTFTAPSSNAYTSQTLGVTVDYVSITESAAIKGSQVGTLCGAYNGNPANDEWQGFINLTNSTLDYRVGSSYYGADCYVTIRYTKSST